MTPHHLLITLIDDVVLSATSSTAGEHRSLDYVPGSALRGAAARALYRSLKPERAWVLFHSGAVRFGDGLPLHPDGQLGYPAPLAFHVPKDTPKVARRGATVNFAVSSFPDQAEQMRGGHVTLDFEEAAVHRDYRLRTTIDPTTGRAAEGQLFGYEAVGRGTRFLARIDIDDGQVSTEERDDLLKAFEEEIRLGRSRATEYGRARVEQVEEPPTPIAAGSAGTTAVIWALSDLALLDEAGLPTLQPSPHHFGVASSDVEIDWTRTFIRSRRYAPFNAALGKYEPEREVIERGSVVTLTTGQGSAIRLLQGEMFVGSHREVGLGWCIVGAPLLAMARPSEASGTNVWHLSSGGAEKAPPAAEPLLARWARGSVRSRKEAVEREIIEHAEEAMALYASATIYSGTSERGLGGPSASQWGHLVRLAKAEANRQAAAETRRKIDGCLFGGNASGEKDGIASGKDWERRGFVGAEKTASVSFRDWLREKLRGYDDSELVLRLGMLARAIGERLKTSDPHSIGGGTDAA